MAYIINKSRVKMIVGIITLLLLLVAFIVAYNYIFKVNNINQQFKFNSQDAAISNGIITESNKSILPEDIQEKIILSKEHNGNLYLLIKKSANEQEVDNHYVYVAKVEKKKEKYRFAKYTADVALYSPGFTKDIDGTPYTTVGIDNIDGLFFAIAKAFDTQYKPLAYNDLVIVQSGDIFATVQESQRPEIILAK